MDNVTVDKDGLMEQLYENNKNGDFLELKVIIPKIKEPEEIKKIRPVVVLDSNKTGPVEHALLLISIEEAIKQIVNKPGVKGAYSALRGRFKSTRFENDRGKK